MYERLPVALAAGLLAAAWAWFSGQLALVTWVGFLGCSAFFAQGEHSFKGVVATWATTVSGACWAWLILYGADKLPLLSGGAILTGLVTAAMCLQAKRQLLAFIPATFIGCCAVFALNGDVTSALLPLILGATLGYGMSCLSQVFAQWLPVRRIEQQE